MDGKGVGIDITTHWADCLSLLIFIIAILTVSLEEFTQLRKSKPMPVAAGTVRALTGMLIGLSYLQFFGFYLKTTHQPTESSMRDEEGLGMPIPLDSKNPLGIFVQVARAEWDTLLFLYRVAPSAGGLGYLNYRPWLQMLCGA